VNTQLQNVERILLIQLKHLGDLLLTTPVIDALAEAFPAAKISVLVNPGMEEMVAGHPKIHEILSLPPRLRQSSGLRRLQKEWSLLQELRARNFDLAVNLSRGDRGGWLSVFSGARYRLGYKVASQEPGYKNWFYNLSVDQPVESIHEVEKNLRLLPGLGIEPSERPLTYAIPREDAEWAEAQLARLQDRPIVHVHPTSRWMFKTWDPYHMAAVMSELQSRGHRIVLTCGPDLDETKHCQAILHHANPDLQFLGTLTLKQLGALIARARVFLGVDSAPMHIAAAVRTPTVALFGPTGAENWSPWQVPSVVLQKSCPCKEARAEKCDWRKDIVRACLAAITVEEVFNAVRKLAAARLSAEELRSPLRL
jgi:lipopolysaccharide heptosyltransferase III